MLRDGELQKALNRKKQASLKRKLGRQLPDRCKRFRGLPKKFCEAAITTILGRGLFRESDDEEEGAGDSSGMKDGKAWRRVLSYGLRVNTELDLPKQHRFAKYEGPLLLVLQKRAADGGFESRLQGITKSNFASLGNYMVSLADNTNIIGKFAGNATITLPWSAIEIGDAANLTIEDNDMMFEAMISNHNLDCKQKLCTLFRSQFPTFEHEVDSEAFEHPTAVVPDIGQPDFKSAAASESQGSAPTSQADKEDAEEGEAGDAPPAIQAPPV